MIEQKKSVNQKTSRLDKLVWRFLKRSLLIGTFFQVFLTCQRAPAYEALRSPQVPGGKLS